MTRLVLLASVIATPALAHPGPAHTHEPLLLWAAIGIIGLVFGGSLALALRSKAKKAKA